MIVRHGVMVVGSTMVGKTTCIDILGNALGTLNEKGEKGTTTTGHKI
jgi:hypothetical protein